jgi:VWFA-related protein
MLRRTAMVVGFGLLATSFSSGGQQPRDDRLTAGTAAVVIDVVVRDKKGNPIIDLRADEFELFEQAVRQPIGAVTSPSVHYRAAGAAQQKLAKADGQTPSRSDAGATATAPAGDAGQPSLFLTAFVFDRLSPEARVLAAKAASAYVSLDKPAGAFTAIYVLDLAPVTVQPFSADVSELTSALDRVAKQGTAPVGTDVAVRSKSLGDANPAVSPTAGAESAGAPANFTELKRLLEPADIVERKLAQIEQRMVAGVRALEHEQQSQSAISGLRAIVGALGLQQGRKTIVYFSEGIPVTANAEPRFQSLVAAANRLNVAFYTVDAAGLRVHSKGAETAREIDRAGRRGLGDLERGDGAWTKDLEHQDEVLRSSGNSALGHLARQTGGFLIDNTNDLGAGLQRIDQDSRAHYLLAYAPLNAVMDGKYRRVQVKVKRGGARVTHRSGYWAIPIQ